MRLLMISPRFYPFMGGLERQAFTLAKTLVLKAVSVTAVTGRHDSYLPCNENIDGVEIRRLPFSSHSVLRGVLFLPCLAAFLLRYGKKFDIFHLHTFGWYMLAVIPIARIMKKPVLLKLPNVGKFGIPGVRKRKLGCLLMKLILSVDAFVAMSWESVQELTSEGIESSRILKTFNGVDTTVYYPSLSEGEKAKIRKRLSLPKGTLCLFSGRLTPQKGVADLISIWPYIIAKIPAAYLILCGHGPQKNELQHLASSFKIEGHVHFTGKVDNIADYYRAADIFVLPSYFEGNSNSLLEAMASGLAVVATDVGGTRILTTSSEANFLIDPGNQKQLQKVLLKFITSSTDRTILGKQLLKRVRNHLSIEIITNYYIRCYKLLVSKHFDTFKELTADFNQEQK